MRAHKDIAGFRAAVLAWFRREQRALAFRGTRDPYRVWLSEVMLQQTRVAAALPHYRRFLRRFPSVRALARAGEEDVLRAWAGLGYYRRARNLHRAAKEIVARHGGRFPRRREEALRLPGVGEYTSAAVLSIAYGQPLAALDGNAARVLARVTGMRGDARRPSNWRRLQKQADRLLSGNSRERGSRPKLDPGEWNQALMELGATLCLPRAPKCAECPVAEMCRARAAGAQEEIPGARRGRAREKVSIAAAVLLDAEGKVLLLRPETGHERELFSGMWQFPAVRVRRDARRELAARLAAMLNGASENGRPVIAEKFAALGSLRHAVTFRDITLLPFLLRVETLPPVPGARVWTAQDADAPAVSSATRKILEAALGRTARRDAALRGR
jgi:A/G-specific adenine glycosylase